MGGKDKAGLTLGARTLLDIMLEKARGVADRVFIVGSKEKFGSDAVEDIYRARGPLGGIHAALRSSPAELNLMLAVDLPFIDARFLKFLIAQAQGSKAVVTVPRTAAGWQPLCAVYRREFADRADAGLKEGKNKIDALFSQMLVNVIEEKEFRRSGFTPEMFANLNTTEDLSKAQESMGRKV
jgi:molybdopterin-guanine dinucleotide biosynthesis protein A